MRSRKPHLLDVVSPLETEGLSLNGALYEGDPTPDGYGVRKNVAFTRKRKMPRSQPDGGARFSYIEFDNRTALFLGMLVDRSFRGHNLGRSLFEYFLGHTEEQGLTFVGTGKINKPLISLVLEREGLTPKSQDHRVEILRPRLSSPNRPPVVRFLRHNPEGEKVVDRSPQGTPFYLVASPGDCKDLPVDPSRIVALHTGYNPAEVSDFPLPSPPATPAQ